MRLESTSLRPATQLRTRFGQEKEDMDIENIVDAIRNNRVRITDHADEEAFNDGLTFESGVCC